MTESEVIEILNDITFQDCGRYPYGTMPKVRDMAIKALENQEKIKEAFEKWQADTSGIYGADDETRILICTLKRILRSDEE